MGICSEELNFLVYRYLLESGFVHSAFTFSYEALILKSGVVVPLSKQVPPGALIAFVQKGWLYLEVEHQVHSARSVDDSATEGADADSRKAMSFLESSIWETLSKTQAVNYIDWNLKHDRSRGEEDEGILTSNTEHEGKRHRPSVVPAQSNTVDQSRTPADLSSSSSMDGNQSRSPMPAPSPAACCQPETGCHVHCANSYAVCKSWQESRLASHSPASEALADCSDVNLPASINTSIGLSREESHVHTSQAKARVTELLGCCQTQVVTLGESMDVAVDPDCRIESDALVADADVIALSGHSAEVFCCAWNPQEEILASGSGDSTVRLWDLRQKPMGEKASQTAFKVLECPTYDNHPLSVSSAEDRDVTTLEWSSDGCLLATGCMDGIARLWTRDGQMKHSLSAHSESIFSLRFSDDSQRILTGSYDKCVSVWDVASGQLRTRFEAHSAQVLDVDWKHGPKLYELPDDSSDAGDDGYVGLDVFASCSTDRTIAICAIPGVEMQQHSTAGGRREHTDHEDEFRSHLGHCQESTASAQNQSNNVELSAGATPREVDDANYFSITRKPLQVLNGHIDEVNAIRWDPSGTLLASCSDDRSVMLWRLGLSTPIRRFREHTEEIYTIRWSPTGPGTRNPSAPLRLASASFDATVKLWDTDAGVCAHTLQKHDKKVYTIAFSPSGELLASGSLGGQVNVWCVRSGTLVKSFVAPNFDFGSGFGSTVASQTHLAVKVEPSTSTDIFEVAWNATGSRLAATSTHAVSVIDLSKMTMQSHGFK
mmetsp:Transcript_17100/g.53414  ORF Transcript_17100/g.53414 Transcript_17100/m.53414 type:complete len:772 (-) Transcript_17100:543-2858(-)|eukprot:CAMPEP_0197395626 /NCGR_PEP_ID=MMETSP1165-20131217/7180_1 /TAXON_ID=284809 /ORGANISM="Chrysocystis fragilis, Strain CCMP3189" /LENGTH=771 /DNA_ID=CAMNT_0042921393 /DNA_START=128 /DNA_END=2443 /DNA_ORIENTATION=+